MALRDIKEIREVDVIEVNQLLKQGYKLIKQPIKVQKSEEEVLVYIVGKEKPE